METLWTPNNVTAYEIYRAAKKMKVLHTIDESIIKLAKLMEQEADGREKETK